MKDSDSKSLEALYESVKLVKEDMEGRPMAQYGSHSPSQTSSVIGTEPLTKAEIELPANAGEESEHDAEDQDTEDNLLKLLDTIKDTINDYEDKKQLRFNKELEESTVNEGVLGSIGKGIASTAKFARDVAAGAADAVKSGDATKYALQQQANKLFQSEKIIGETDKVTNKKVLPIKNKEVIAVLDGKINPNVRGTITNLYNNNKYSVQLQSKKYLFAISNSTYEDILNPEETLKNKQQNSKAEVTSKSENVIILDRTKLNTENRKNYKLLGLSAVFQVGIGSVGWSYPNYEKQDNAPQQGKPVRPSIGTKFNYQGKQYNYAGNAWYFNNQPVRNPLQQQIMNAWRQQNGGNVVQAQTPQPQQNTGAPNGSVATIQGVNYKKNDEGIWQRLRANGSVQSVAAGNLIPSLEQAAKPAPAPRPPRTGKIQRK
jgi:hypothetical protein